MSRTLRVYWLSGDTLFLFAGGGQRYVLRLFAPSMSPFQLETKVHMMQYVDQAGVGPRIVSLSEDKRVVIVDPKNWTGIVV
jgi:hypothetical protein